MGALRAGLVVSTCGVRFVKPNVGGPKGRAIQVIPIVGGSSAI